MISYFSSGFSRIRNLPFILKGDSLEKKLRLTLLIAGTSSILAGVYMVLFNLTRGHYDVACLYSISTMLGCYITCAAFCSGLKRNLYIIVHALLLSIILLLLLDNYHTIGKRSEYNYLMALTIGSALVLRQQSGYLSKVFPLMCLAFYLLFIATGLTWQNGAFRLSRCC